MPEVRPGVPKKSSAFYHEMEKLLLTQLLKSPGQHDLRVKLAELYFETGRANEFQREARRLKDAIGDPGSAEWQRLASMGRMLAPQDDLYALARGEGITFVDPLDAATRPMRERIGENEKYQKHFGVLAAAYEKLVSDGKFLSEFDTELVRFGGRPTSLLHAERLSRKFGGAQIYFKREDLGPPYSHLLLSVLGQGLVAKRLGRKTLVAASTRGHNGVVVAAVAAHLGLKAVIYMHSEDMQRHSSNVFRIWLLGAVVESVTFKGKMPSDVRYVALDHWARDPGDCFLVLGLDAGPHPYPIMAQAFSSVIGRECRRQLMVQAQRAPDVLVTRAGNNADAIGFFPPFLGDKDTRMVCVEGRSQLGERERERGAAPSEPVFDVKMHRLNERETQKAGAVLDGLEYASVTREHLWFKASGRVEYLKTSTSRAKDAITDLARLEGIIPAIETAHAVGWACQTAGKMKREQAIIVMLAEGSDKDIWDIAQAMGMPG